MKKLSGALYFFAMAFIIFSLSGCNGGHSGKGSTVDTAKVKEVAVLTSPALEVYRDYKIIQGASINGMDGAQYYVAGDIGDEASQATLNLGLSEEFDLDSSFAVVNVSTNRVVFAYDPKGIPNSWKTGGNIALSGGTLFDYNSLTIEQEPSSVSNIAMAAFNYDTSDIIYIKLNSANATLNNFETVPIYDYVWHAEPNSRYEYFTNSVNEDVIDVSVNDAVYIAHDIKYLTSNANFTDTITKDGETEHAAYYDNSVASELENEYGSDFAGPYIFATLPSIPNSSLSSVKALMTHSAQEAYENPVLHITEKGIYSLSGTWNGQISIEADAVIILNSVDITCTVAPAFIFTDSDNITEYGDINENNIETNYKNIGQTLLDDLTQQQANLVIIADDTTNNVTGSNVYRIMKAEPKSSATKVDGKDISDQKKLYKTDGAFYSYVSLAICGETDGTGVLNINSTTFEGLDSELHMTIEGGKINITASDDGINVNEDNISVFTQLGGTLTIKSTNGDGIDSNGYIVINGGNLDITAGTQKASSTGEAGLDAEKSYYVSENANYVWNAINDKKEAILDLDENDSDEDNDNSWIDIQRDNMNSTMQTMNSKEKDYKFSDADILSAVKQTEKGVTALNIGTGSNLSFIQQDTDPKARNINTKGNVFRLDRKINTFSGITH